MKGDVMHKRWLEKPRVRAAHRQRLAVVLVIVAACTLFGWYIVAPVLRQPIQQGGQQSYPYLPLHTWLHLIGLPAAVLVPVLLWATVSTDPGMLPPDPSATSGDDPSEVSDSQESHSLLGRSGDSDGGPDTSLGKVSDGELRCKVPGCGAKREPGASEQAKSTPVARVWMCAHLVR